MRPFVEQKETLKLLLTSHWGWLLGCVVSFLSLKFQFNALANQDLAWHLHVANLMLQGKELYVDILDPNLPLMFYWAIFQYIAAKSLGLDPFIAMHIINYFAAIWAIATLHFTLRFTSIGRRNSTSQSFLLFSFLVIFILPLCSWANSFFNKDVMVIPFILPYLILCIGRLERDIRPDYVSLIMVGFMAGLAISIKPYFLLVPLAAEAYIWFILRKTQYRFTAETVVLLITTGLYYLFVFLRHPEYLTDMLPIISFTHPLYTSPAPIIREFIWTGLMPTLAIICSALFICKSEITRFFMVITLTFTAITLLQNKGWVYQIYPAMAMGYLLLYAVLFDLIYYRTVQKNLSPLTFKIQCGLLAFCAFLIILRGVVPYYEQFSKLFFTTHLSQLYSMTPVTQAINMTRSKRPEVLILSESLHNSYPAINYSKATSAFPFPFLFPITAMENYRTTHKDDLSTEEIEDAISDVKIYFFDQVKHYFNHHTPHIIIARNRGNFHMRWESNPLNYIDYLKTDPQLADILSRYTLLKSHDTLSPYDVYALPNVLISQEARK